MLRTYWNVQRVHGGDVGVHEVRLRGCRVHERLEVHGWPTCRNAVSGGEEMLRLRAYEKLQNLVTRGMVEKIGKEYKGTARVHEASSSFVAAQINDD